MADLRPWLKKNKRKLPRKPSVPYHPYIYSSYIRSPKWKQMRDRVLSRDKGKCVDCGDVATQIHHQTYDRIFREDTDDLVALCSTCHAKRHNRYKPKRRKV